MCAAFAVCRRTPPQQEILTGRSDVCRPQVPGFLVSLSELLQITAGDAARTVTAAVAAQIRGILLEASAAQRQEVTHSARWAPPLAHSAQVCSLDLEDLRCKTYIRRAVTARALVG